MLLVKFNFVKYLIIGVVHKMQATGVYYWWNLHKMVSISLWQKCSLWRSKFTVAWDVSLVAISGYKRTEH